MEYLNEQLSLDKSLLLFINCEESCLNWGDKHHKITTIINDYENALEK